MFEHSDSGDSSQTSSEVQVVLDGRPVSLPKERCSVAGVRAFLETCAFEQQRILCALTVDGRLVDLARPAPLVSNFSRIVAHTMALEHMPLHLVRTAMKQVVQARNHVVSAVPLVVINDGSQARELWWELARHLKQPLVTLSLMPETACGPAIENRTSLVQLRKWQLQQLASVMQDTDAACSAEDSTALSNALEYRVLPWLDGLQNSLELWHTTLQAARDLEGQGR
jgi:hypothetical protein